MNDSLQFVTRFIILPQQPVKVSKFVAVVVWCPRLSYLPGDFIDTERFNSPLHNVMRLTQCVCRA